jgi:hypothetical protein
MVHIRNLGFRSNLRVNQRQMVNTGDSFRQTLARVMFGEHRLSLQVGGFDEIAVNNQKASDTGTRQAFGLRRSQRTATDDDGTRARKTLLSRLANAIKKYLPAITL